MNSPRRFMIVKQKDGVRQSHGTVILLTEGNPLWITSHSLDPAMGVSYFISLDGGVANTQPILDAVEDRFPIQGMAAPDSLSPYIYRLALGERESSDEG